MVCFYLKTTRSIVAVRMFSGAMNFNPLVSFRSISFGSEMLFDHKTFLDCCSKIKRTQSGWVAIRINFGVWFVLCSVNGFMQRSFIFIWFTQCWSIISEGKIERASIVKVRSSKSMIFFSIIYLKNKAHILSFMCLFYFSSCSCSSSFSDDSNDNESTVDLLTNVFLIEYVLRLIGSITRRYCSVLFRSDINHWC